MRSLQWQDIIVFIRGTQFRPATIFETSSFKAFTQKEGMIGVRGGDNDGKTDGSRILSVAHRDLNDGVALLTNSGRHGDSSIGIGATQNNTRIGNQRGIAGGSGHDECIRRSFIISHDKREWPGRAVGGNRLLGNLRNEWGSIALRAAADWILRIEEMIKNDIASKALRPEFETTDLSAISVRDFQLGSGRLISIGSHKQFHGTIGSASFGPLNPNVRSEERR